MPDECESFPFICAPECVLPGIRLLPFVYGRSKHYSREFICAALLLVWRADGSMCTDLTRLMDVHVSIGHLLSVVQFKTLFAQNLLQTYMFTHINWFNYSIRFQQRYNKLYLIMNRHLILLVARKLICNWQILIYILSHNRRLEITIIIQYSLS